jgi:hypothetical protein
LSKGWETPTSIATTGPPVSTEIYPSRVRLDPFSRV